jgi:hypothetical protein
MCAVSVLIADDHEIVRCGICALNAYFLPNVKLLRSFFHASHAHTRLRIRIAVNRRSGVRCFPSSPQDRTQAFLTKSSGGNTYANRHYVHSGCQC